MDIYVLVYYFYARTLAQVRDARALPFRQAQGVTMMAALRTGPGGYWMASDPHRREFFRVIQILHLILSSRAVSECSGDTGSWRSQPRVL